LEPINQLVDSSLFKFIAGSAPEIGQYKINIRSKLSAEKISSTAYSIPPELDASEINKLILASLARTHQRSGHLLLFQNDRIPGPQQNGNDANFVASQFTINGIFLISKISKIVVPKNYLNFQRFKNEPQF